MRSYDNTPTLAGDSVEAPIATLRRLPRAANPRPYEPHEPIVVSHPTEPDVEFTISAQESVIVYNKNNDNFRNRKGKVYTVDKVRAKKKGILQDQNVSTEAGQPLMLRANAGNWVKVILNNRIPTPGPTPPKVSTTVGLHPQLVAYDMSSSNGADVGFNPSQIISSGAGSSQEYWWYAGRPNGFGRRKSARSSWLTWNASAEPKCLSAKTRPESFWSAKDRSKKSRSARTQFRQ
jgi:hypothetical protein